MPRVAKKLSTIELARLGPGIHSVGGVAGLLLQVSKGNGRSWVLRTIVGAKRREIGLGPYPEVSLATARQKAAEVKEQIRNGVDPVEQRKAIRAEIVASQKRGLLFSQAVDQFTPVKMAELSEGKYRVQWRDSIDRYAIPILGQMLVNDITLQDILRVLEPIWTEKTVTADKLRRKLNEILDYVTVKGHRAGPNPARWEGNLSIVLQAPSNVSGSENYPSLQLRDASRFWAALLQRKGMGAMALKLQSLTVTRAGAIRFMTWREIDFSSHMWTVQPGRKSAKIGRRDTAKRVPLSSAAMEVLASLPRRNDTDLVFWGPSGVALSDATLAKLMRVIHEADVSGDGRGFVDVKTGEVVVPHGTRSTFKVWAAEQTDYDWNLSEAALWHKLGGKVEQAYARTDMFEKRREMMDAWAEYLVQA